MRILLWLLRGVVFVALFGLAVKNSGPVDLRFYFGGEWQLPLALVVLGAFVLGVLIGLTATLSIVVRQGRNLRRLQGAARRNSRDPEK
jgi:uncharacterized integral membrane protein